MTISEESNKSMDIQASSGVYPQSGNTPACEVGQKPLPRPTPDDATPRENLEEPQAQTRDEVLKIRVSKAEKLSWGKFARELGLSISAMFRHAAKKLVGVRDNLLRYIQTKPMSLTISEPLLRELNAIGININQIAHGVNASLRNGDSVDWVSVISKLISIEIRLSEILEAIKSKKEGSHDSYAN